MIIVKTVLIMLTVGLASCASMKPDNELLVERGLQARNPTPPDLGKPTVPKFRQSLAKGGDKNDDGGYGGSGGTGDGGG